MSKFGKSSNITKEKHTQGETFKSSKPPFK